jgi:hypothetical protein
VIGVKTGPHPIRNNTNTKTTGRKRFNI